MVGGSEADGTLPPPQPHHARPSPDSHLHKTAQEGDTTKTYKSKEETSTNRGNHNKYQCHIFIHNAATFHVSQPPNPYLIFFGSEKYHLTATSLPTYRHIHTLYPIT